MWAYASYALTEEKRVNRPFRRDSFLACTVVLLTTCFCVVFAVKAADAVEFTPRSIGGGVASGPFYRGLIGSAGFAVQWHNFDVSASTVIFRDLSVDGGATSSLYRFGMAIVGWLGGFGFDLTGGYQSAFLVGVGFNLVNLAIVGFLIGATRRPRLTSVTA